MPPRTDLETSANDRARLVAVALMRDGRATMAEVSHLAGTSRQLVAFWAMRAGINVTQTRAEYLAREWQRAGGTPP